MMRKKSSTVTSQDCVTEAKGRYQQTNTIDGSHFPECTQNPIHESECHLSRALWLSVLVQATVDARTKSRKRNRRADRAEALDWLSKGLRHDNSDFATVCDLAGIPLDVGRNVVIQLLNNPAGALDFRKLRKDSKQSRGVASDH